MKTCTKCKKKLGLFDKIFCHGLCGSCKSKEEEKQRKDDEERKKIRGVELKKIDRVKEKLKKFEDEYELLQYRNLKYDYSFNEKYENESYEIYLPDCGASGICHKKDKSKKYSCDIKKVFERIIKNNFDAEKTLGEIEEEIEYKLQVDNLKEKERGRKIRENAEKDFYGRVKSKRDNISLDKRKDILRRFNNRCVICDREEGLHIHHKDNNPKNNLPENLIVLCWVCHKKAHMKVR